MRPFMLLLSLATISSAAHAQSTLLSWTVSAHGVGGAGGLNGDGFPDIVAPLRICNQPNFVKAFSGYEVPPLPFIAGMPVVVHAVVFGTTSPLGADLSNALVGIGGF